MKRFLYVMLILIVGIGVYLLIDYSNNKNIEDDYYTLPEGRGYVIDEGRTMEFNVYSNNKDSLIGLASMNSYKLKTTDISLNLENVGVNKYKIPGAYLYKIKANVPEITDSEVSSECKLLIENSSFNLTLDVGIISFLKPNDMTLLDFDKISPSGSFINKHLNIVGFSLRLKDKYKLITSFRCGEFAYGRLNEAIDSFLDSRISIKKVIPSYNPFVMSVGEHEINESIFIPIAYKRMLQLKESYIVLEIDNTTYYIDTFPFDSGTIDFLEYKEIMSKGEIKYARGN